MPKAKLATPSQIIREYIQTHSIDQSAFAKLADVSPGMVWQWLNDERPVAPKRALRIERETAGEISRHDLCPEIYPRDTAA